MESTLDHMLQAAADTQRIPGTAALALDISGNVLYKKVASTNNINDPTAAAYTASTTTLMWSATKLVTSIAALQLVEQGKLSLDDLVEKYVPEIRDIKVLDGVDENGTVRLRPQKSKATVLNLMTHTAGFSYDFFDKLTLQWRTEAGQKHAQYLPVSSMQAFSSPFVNDPGRGFCYGVSTDWLGFVVEAVSGLPINNYIDKHITGVLGLKNTGSNVQAGRDRLAVHLRSEDGKLTAAPAILPALSPERFAGGHFLLSTLDDYSDILLTILNKGTHPKSGFKILEQKSVTDYLFTDQISQICSNDNIGIIHTADPVRSLTGRFLPGVKLGWSCGLMLNLEDTPNGRKAGSGAWAGLGNLFYWIDPQSGKLGLIVSSILPFMDKEVLHLFDALERATYGKEMAEQMGGKGSNFSVP